MPRQDYEERKEARINRLVERAQKARSASNSTYDRAHKLASVIPLGQPVLVGHYSERRDRRYRNRIHGTFGKAFELDGKAKHLAGRAASAESNTAISSDDPEALVKLRDKIAHAETLRDADKEDNKRFRKAKLKVATFTHDDLITAGVSTAGQREILTLKRIGCLYGELVKIPGYKISNATANIKRMKDRLASLEKELERADEGDTTTEYDGFEVVENVDENRVQIVFPGKPSADVRTILKSHGFRWSRYNGAWQRLLNNAGRNAAKYVAGLIEGKV